MKRFFKLLTASLSLAVILTFSALSVSAADNAPAKGYDGNVSECKVYDDKELFTDAELDELNEIVQETSEELGLYIAVYLSNYRYSESQTLIAADEFYEDLFGADTDGLIYYMDLSERPSPYDYVSTSGKAMLVYDNQIDFMLDEIFEHLPASGEPIESEEIYDGIRSICSIIKYRYSEPDSNDVVYDSYTKKYIYYKDGKTLISSHRPFNYILRRGFIAGIPVGIIVGLLFYFITKHNYKFKPSCNSSIYVEHDKTNFTQREDRFIRVYTTKTKIESSSSSGGGGGSHGGSGSHGGGGGHR